MAMNFGRIKESKLMPIHVGGAVACALLLAVGWLFGLGPLLTETQQATSIVTEADQAEASAAQGSVELKQLNQKLEQIKARLEKQPVSLEPASKINPLLLQLAGVTKAHELEITKTQAGRPIALAYYDYVPIQLSGEGKYADLLGLFKTLYTKRGDLGVVSFKAKRLGSDAKLSFDIELAWYVLSDHAAPAGNTATAAVKSE